jgi:hypothetical protein
MKSCDLKVNGCIGGHHVKWSKPVSERQGPHVFSHMSKIDTIQIWEIFWETGMLREVTIGRVTVKEGS